MKALMFLLLTCFAVTAQAQQCIEPDTSPACKEAPPPSSRDKFRNSGKDTDVALRQMVPTSRCGTSPRSGPGGRLLGSCLRLTGFSKQGSRAGSVQPKHVARFRKTA